MLKGLKELEKYCSPAEITEHKKLLKKLFSQTLEILNCGYFIFQVNEFSMWKEIAFFFMSTSHRDCVPL